MTINEINQLFEERRSHFVKEFNGAIAPIELIEQLIQNANWAPSHKLTLPWRFVVFGHNQLPNLVNATKQSMLEMNPETADEKLTKVSKVEEKVSHAIAIILCPSNQVPLWEEHASIGAAIQNMYLTLNAWDHFGGYWTTGMATNSALVREFLKLQSHEQHLGYFIIGGLDTKRKQAHRPAPIVDFKL